jgi:RimJ/RimL family protein N-acetyltransferase
VTLALRTARLLLRPVEEDDLDALLARRRASWREHGLGSWLVLLEGEPVAFVDVAPIGEGSSVDAEEIEIGVVVHPPGPERRCPLSRATRGP